MINKKLILMGLAALCMSLGMQSCTKQDVSGKVITLPLTDDIKSLDPSIAYDSVSLTVMPLAMESLFQYKYAKSPLELEPLLAASMPEISKDKKTYTIKLKNGVLWQDDVAFPGGKGRELVAQDFIYAWKRMLLPNLQSPGTWIFDGKVVGWDNFHKKITENKDPAKLSEIFNEEVEGMKAIDNYTIQIKLTQPYPQLLFVLAMGFGAPMAKEVTDKYGQDAFTARMVGTGPYMLKSLTKGSKVVLVKNPTFRGEAYPTEIDAEAKAAGLAEGVGKQIPFNDGIVFQIIKEDQPRWLNFLKGNLDASGIPKDSFDTAVENGELKKEYTDKGIKLEKSEEAVAWYLNFNMKDKIVGGNNVNLRKAISMAIDRDAYIKKFLNGRGVKGTSIVPRVIAGFSERTETFNDYNLEKAKEYLKKAGYPDGKGLPVIKYDLRGPSTTALQQGEWIQKSLEAIGVKLEVVRNTFPAYLDKEKNGNLQFFLGGWNADFPDAENFLFLLYSKNVAPGPNASNYINPAFDKLYEQIAQMAPSPARSELIKKAEDIALDKDSVWSMMYYPVTYGISHGWLKNYRTNAQILNEVKYWDLDIEKKKELKGKL